MSPFSVRPHQIFLFTISLYAITISFPPSPEFVLVQVSSTWDMITFPVSSYGPCILHTHWNPYNTLTDTVQIEIGTWTWSVNGQANVRHHTSMYCRQYSYFINFPSLWYVIIQRFSCADKYVTVQLTSLGALQSNRFRTRHDGILIPSLLVSRAC